MDCRQLGLCRGRGRADYGRPRTTPLPWIGGFASPAPCPMWESAGQGADTGTRKIPPGRPPAGSGPWGPQSAAEHGGGQPREATAASIHVMPTSERAAQARCRADRPIAASGRRMAARMTGVTMQPGTYHTKSTAEWTALATRPGTIPAKQNAMWLETRDRKAGRHHQAQSPITVASHASPGIPVSTAISTYPLSAWTYSRF